MCASAVHLPQVFASFNEKKAAIYSLYRQQPGLDPELVVETLAYCDEFYRTINDPRSVRREFENPCR